MRGNIHLCSRNRPKSPANRDQPPRHRSRKRAAFSTNPDLFSTPDYPEPQHQKLSHHQPLRETCKISLPRPMLPPAQAAVSCHHLLLASDSSHQVSNISCFLTGIPCMIPSSFSFVFVTLVLVRAAPAPLTTAVTILCIRVPRRLLTPRARGSRCRLAVKVELLSVCTWP